MEFSDYARDFEALYAECTRRGIAIQTIKSIARRNYRGEQRFNTWYVPLTEDADIERAVYRVLEREGVFLVSVAELELLPKVVAAATYFDPECAPTVEEMRGMAERLGMEPVFLAPPGI